MIEDTTKLTSGVAWIENVGDNVKKALLVLAEKAKKRPVHGFENLKNSKNIIAFRSRLQVVFVAVDCVRTNENLILVAEGVFAGTTGREIKLMSKLSVTSKLHLRYMLRTVFPPECNLEIKEEIKSLRVSGKIAGASTAKKKSTKKERMLGLA